MNWKTFHIIFCLALTAVFAQADQGIEAAQQKLKDQGFYYGEITGKHDADTIAAIRRYQIRNGLQITGELNAETQHALGLGSKPAVTPKPRPAQSPAPTPPGFLEETPAPTVAPAPRSPAQPREDFGTVPAQPDPNPPRFQSPAPLAETPYEMAPPQIQQEIILQAQIRLMRSGYYREEIDGLYGPAMNFALRNYQARYGLQPTGRLDVETLAALDLLPEQRVTRAPRSPRRFFPPWMRRGPGNERIYIPR